ncbi:MAG: fibrinogen-like YCDxxxxGGGW domain-containing protein [Actinomycetes bacterium]
MAAIMTAAPRRPVRSLLAAMTAALLAAPVVLTGAPPVSAAATTTGRDGLTMATAGASCWGIRQEFPSSPDGTYWVVTPRLEKPVQVWCEMSTDGGGWVLVGRGRDGWSFARDGQNSSTQVRSPVSGPAAFTPAALGTDLIDGLVDGARTSDLVDGIRVRRALDTAGVTWQDLRLVVKDQGAWSWAFGGGIQLSSTTIATAGGSSTYSWGNTRDSAVAWGGQPSNGLTGVNDARRMITYPLNSHGGRGGFSYGGSVAGLNDSTSYLWQLASEKYAVAFTQVFVRPRLSNDTLPPPVPSGGLPAVQRPWGLRQRPEAATWGVTGLDHTGESQTDPWGAPVLSLKVAGDRVYVGGRFTGVQQGPAGVPVAQAFLAAFDRRTGDWIDSFRPRLDGRVWNIVVAPNGQLIVGGDFLSANGSPGTTGLAMLDPATGATVSSWTANLRRESTTGERAVARAVALSSDSLYVAGRFTHVTGGSTREKRVTNAVRLRLSDGAPVAGWAPSVPATTARMALSPLGDRIHLAGYFDRVNGDTTAGYFATLDAVTGAVLPGQGAFQPSNATASKYQLAVAEVGDTVVVGGAQHELQQYRRSDRQLVSAHVMLVGGDTQALAVVRGQLFAACHCYDWAFHGTNSWPSPVNYRGVDPINSIAMFDPVTFEHRASFHPASLRGSAVMDGVWAMEGDSSDCLWFGGDVTRRAYTGDAVTDWLGNFGRFCPEDQTVPTTPGTPTATSFDTSLTLKWAPSADAVGPLEYWVYRDGRVVGTTTGTTFTDTGRTGPASYVVRAVDAAGNRSPSTAPVTLTPFGVVLSPMKATWRWVYPSTDPPPEWSSRSFDDSSWAVGNGEFGYGDADEATVVSTAASPRPITAYFRRSVVVDDPAAFTDFVVDVVRDDGVAVWVNGVEVCRNNLPAGPLTSSTPASAVVSTRTDETTPIRCAIPAGVLTPGANVVAAEVHNSDRWSSDVSFDLRLGGRR